MAAQGAQARQSRLTVRKLGDEVLVCDLERDTMLCLNQSYSAMILDIYPRRRLP